MAVSHMVTKARATKTIVIVAILLLSFFFVYNYASWKYNYQNNIYPNVKIGDLDLGGLTLDQAKAKILARTNSIETVGLKFQYNQKVVVLSSTVSSFDADLSYPALVMSAEETANKAFGATEDHSFFNYLSIRYRLKSVEPLKAQYTLNEEQVRSFLAESFKELNITPSNAYFSLSAQAGETKLKNNAETPGKRINYQEILTTLHNNLDDLKNETILIKTQSEYPSIKQSDLAGQEAAAQNIISRGSLILNLPNNYTASPNSATTTIKYWEVKPNKLATWISVNKEDGVLQISLDQEKIKEYLKNQISPEVDKPAIRPRLEIKDGRVTSWQKGENGEQLDLDSTAALINNSLLAGQNNINIIITPIPGDIDTGLNGDNLKIQEIIGTGHSNFVGSTANRIHNIKTGASAIEGVLIKPGEEFSLIKTLGEIDGESGYLPELVIKGDKTIPEFGGGLCQIGTTVFRTALASGLPITMRQNHSYRVSYYEPAGTDATIYDPSPDLRFLNDTGNYILIQSRIQKNDLYFDFWGVKDGRVAATTTPVIYNIVKPAPTKLIETADLKPGEKKCTEHAHNGADAYFDYTVTYPSSSTTTPVHQRRFTSHYIPWQEVCLIGKSATSTDSSLLNTATSTIPVEGNKKATGTPAASQN